MKTRRVKDAALRLEWVEASSLTENPRNWRRHPEGQRSAFQRSIEATGWTDALIFNETTGRLIDGHMRREEAIARDGPGAVVPVLIGRWAPEVELALLAGLDPSSLLAEADRELLITLREGTPLGELDAYLDKLLTPEVAKAQALPGAGSLPGASYMVVCDCPSEKVQTKLYELLTAAPGNVKVRTVTHG